MNRLASFLPLAAAAMILAGCADGVTTSDSGISSSGASTRTPATGPITGAIQTSLSNGAGACNVVNGNVQYTDRESVYLKGGAQNGSPHGPLLTNGWYYVQVTEPNGTVLGTSVTSATQDSSELVVQVTNGLVSCVQLWGLVKHQDGNGVWQQGYELTTNPGGEYKVWLSASRTFDESLSKTDNFKIRVSDDPPPNALLTIQKFYDANTDGNKDPGEPLLTGWQVGLTPAGEAEETHWTTFAEVRNLGDYAATESMPTQTNWMRTTPAVIPVSFTLTASGHTVTFGNVCVGAGGGLTLGFWSNKNGQSIMGSGAPLARLTGLNLVDANGAAFDPGSYASFRSWILSANATNMAYMLSAQLAAMSNNVAYLKVSGTAMIHAPGAQGANSAGFTTVNALMNEANASLGANPQTVQSGTAREYQEALKNALDRGNNNLNFAQAQPCAFTF